MKIYLRIIYSPIILLLFSYYSPIILLLFSYYTLRQGVSKLVGEGVRTRRTFKKTIPTIGVAAWGTVRDREQLVSEDGQVIR